METKIKYGDEEVSEKVVEKIRQEAERDLKKDLFRQVVRKDYKCNKCQGLPRPGDNNFMKCSYCEKVACGKCNFKNLLKEGKMHVPQSAHLTDEEGSRGSYQGLGQNH